MHIRKGDTVKILSGRDRGKTGKVLTVDRQDMRAVVEGVNILTRHERPKKSGQKGQKVQVPSSLPASRIALVCPHCGKPTRIGHKVEDGVRFRFCKQCGKIIK